MDGGWLPGRGLMGKNSNFPRVDKDLYRTWDKRAIPTLLAQLPPGASFIEPCAGHGDLAANLIEGGLECVGAFDLSPPKTDLISLATRYGDTTVRQGDATKFKLAKHYDQRVDFFITNPPWSRPIMHAIIFNLYWQRPTWMLFDSGWINSEAARPYMPLCRRVIPNPRLQWFKDTEHNATDDTAWHMFAPAGYPEFRGRL